MEKRILRIIFLTFIFLLIFPTALAQVPPDKSLIKSSDSPKVYWFQNNIYYFIPDWDTFTKMDPLWKSENIITYDPTSFRNILNNYRQGPSFFATSDGLLIKKTYPTVESAVYLTHINQKRAFFNYDALIDPSYHFNEANIISVTATLRDSIPSGDLVYAVGYNSGNSARIDLFRDAFDRGGATYNLGYARTTTQPWGAGQIQYFKMSTENSAIVYNPNENYAYPTYGAIYTKYTARGANIYGFPIGDENWGIDSSVTGARATFQRFRGGSNTDTSINHHQTGTRAGLTVETHTPILEKWAAIGYGASCAGLPTSDVYSWQSGLRADFENGYIYWDGQRAIASCEPTQDECTQGATRCLTSSTKQTCGNYDEDVWLEWGNDLTCAFGCNTGTGQCNQGSSCSNGIKDPTETDIDCGGSCSACPNNKACSINNDCQSNYCNPNNICSVPSCTDGWRNGNEEGKDCGGSCPACPTPECENPTGSDELTANQPSGAGQQFPSIAMDPQGNFVITWQSPDGSEDGIFAQRFNADGSKAGDEFMVNTFTTNNQQQPKIAMDSQGNFVITWQRDQGDTNFWDIYAQRYSRDGNKLGNEFRVNTFTPEYQTKPSIAMDSQGNFVITWPSGLQDDSLFNIYAQRYDYNGNKLGGEFRVNTYLDGWQGDPDVTIDSQGDFVIVWESAVQDGSDMGVYAQRYSRDGNKLGNEFRVNSYTANGQSDPVIAMDSQGNFVVTWQSWRQVNADSRSDIFAQRFNSNGEKLGSEIQVNNYVTEDQQNPSIAMDTNGNFVITWRGYGGPVDGFDIFARRFDINGNPLSGEFDVNTYAPKDEDAPVVAMTSKTNFVIAWYSWRENNQYDVIYRMYKCAPLCSNNIKDPTETDKDCGGSCPACSDGKICSINNDCQNNYCNPNKICSVPSCTDGWQNQGELGKDCGGPCAACPIPECNANIFPELFIYDAQKNENLYNALFTISQEFGKNKVDINQELLAPIITTLQKEVGGAFLPVEEGGDYGMGPGCTYKVQGQCRSTPYDGGIDYKGRGYIQITHKGNYQKHCGLNCVGTSAPELDICGCKNQFHCTIKDERICPQIKALKNNYAGRIFASYYTKETYGGKNLVTLSYEKSYWNVGKRIQGGDVYADDFEVKADNYLNLFSTEKTKTENLISCLSFQENLDSDNDGLINSIDKCPFDDDCDNDGLTDGNKGTEDANINGIVDIGETDPENFDTDGDGISDGVEKGITIPQGEDTDPTIFIPDTDPSTTTDPTNPDSDGDGLVDGQEDKNQNGAVDTQESSPTITDTDLDTIEDSNDNCPSTANPAQEDNDNDGKGDVCDICPQDSENDIDIDNVCGNIDNCPLISNPDQLDADKNTVGDACNEFEDSDGDEYANTLDNCPLISNSGQEDADNNKIGDACEIKFLRGDSNTDGEVDISDPIKTLLYLYSDSQILCKETADTNDDGKIDISDSIFTLDFLFKAGPTIKEPYPSLGIDTTPENPDLGCESYNPPEQAGGGGGLTPEDILNDPNTDQSIKDIIKPYACLLNGDVDQNKKVDMNDYYSLSYALSGKFKINELCKCNADVNEDKLINQNDASTLYNSIRYNKPLVKEGECEKVSLSSSSPTPTPYPSPTSSPSLSPY